MPLLKTLILALLVSGGAAGLAVAGPFEDATVAQQKGDNATALRLFRLLAEQGDARAQEYLGYMYRKGLGVPQDYALAVAWYRKAAEQGDAEAQGLLGYMYEEGQGVPQDYVQAHMWYNLAAVQDGIAANARDLVAAKMTPAQIAEAHKLAREWKPKPGR